MPRNYTFFWSLPGTFRVTFRPGRIDRLCFSRASLPRSGGIAMCVVLHHARTKISASYLFFDERCYFFSFRSLLLF